MRSKIVQFGSPKAAYYDGLLMRANPALHDEAMHLLRSFVSSGSTAVDLGSGQGAFSSRLRDNGYDVTAVDKNVEDFKAEGVTFVPLDFDDPAQVDVFRRESLNRYDLAVGMEVIEHVENPWEYCRLLLSMVKPGGIVLITTPNPESALSRVEYLLTGKFLHFDMPDYHESGHINPLTFHELGLILSKLDAEVLALEALCALPWLMVSRKPSVMLKAMLAALMRPFAGPRGRGDIIGLVLRKSAG